MAVSGLHGMICAFGREIQRADWLCKGCSFSVPRLGDVVFVGAAGVTVTDDISRALAFAIKWVAVGIAVSPMLYGLAKLVIALKS